MSEKIKEEMDCNQYELEGKIEDVLENLKKAIAKFKEKYPTCKGLHFDLSHEEGYEGEITIVFSIYGYRDKNEKDKEQEKNEEQHETGKRKRQYLKLKKEFGGVVA